MAKKFDVGIVGWWYNDNYGGILTYYSLNKALENMGHSVLMISRMKDDPNFKEGQNRIPMRFGKKYYHISDYYTNAESVQLNDICDTFISGSDQLFNPGLMAYSGQQYYLGFVADEKTKVSYASSFGNKNYPLTQHHAQMKKWIDRFDSLSAREDYGVDIFKDNFGKKSKKVVDSVFLCERSEYDKLAAKSKNKVDYPYFVSFMLDPNEDKRSTVLWLREKLGMKSVNLLNAINFEKNAAAMNLDNTFPGIDVEDWLNYYQNSDFVITDSFHGTCFAIIFRKKFISVANMKRGADRFVSLLNELGLSDRLVYSLDEIKDRPELFDEIDYDEVYRKFAPKIEESRQWLKNAVEQPSRGALLQKKNKCIQMNLKKSRCTGCSACVNACPVGALTLEPDEYGYYRSTINVEKCINCGKCTQVCPVLKKPANENSAQPKVYKAVAADRELVQNSSSGGVFSLIADEVLKRSGYIVGAAWKDDLSVEHIMIHDKKDMPKLRKSKYLQSYVGNTFAEVKEKLDNNEFVLFSGCPCQVAGLKAFLGKDYDNLLLVDIFCGSAPSTLFFQKYLQSDFDGRQIDRYEFRNKKYGWNCTTIAAYTEDGQEIIRNGIAEDNYQRVYHSHTMCPEHCEHCQFHNLPRFGDITVGDFWKIASFDKKINTKDGVSAVLCNNQKGQDFWDSIPQEQFSVKKEAPFAWLDDNGRARVGSKMLVSPKRDDFYDAIMVKEFNDAVNYALKPDHGKLMYRPDRDKMPALAYDVQYLHFKFEENFWEEKWANGVTTLTVKPGKTIPGHHAALMLNGCLKMGKKYRLNMKFKADTDAPILSFHIKDSGSDAVQVVYKYKAQETRNKWIEIQEDFVPQQSFFDRFSIGAAQLLGKHAHLSIGYINIFEL